MINIIKRTELARIVMAKRRRSSKEASKETGLPV